MFFILKRLNQQ